MLIQTNASKKGWNIDRGQWSKEEQLLHINVLELKPVKLELLTFDKQKILIAVHFQIDGTTAIFY